MRSVASIILIETVDPVEAPGSVIRSHDGNMWTWLSCEMGASLPLLIESECKSC